MSQNIIEILIQARDQASQILKANSKQLIEVGAALSIASAAIVAGLGLSAQAAVRYEESMTNTAAVLQLTREQQAALSDEILRFGKDTRAGPQEVAQAYYDIVGGIADASTHMAVLEAATRTAEAGNAQLGSTTSALVGIMNSYNFTADQAALASNVLTQTVAKGVGTMDQFAAAFPTVTGRAAALGISFDQLGAQMAFLTTKGFSASQSGTMLAGMMQSLINPSATMKKLFAELGITSGEAAIKNFGLVGTFDSLKDAAARSNVSLAAAIGQSEAYNGVVALTTQQAADALNNFSVGLDNATESARNIQMQSAAAQLDLLKSSVEGIRIQVGEALIPIINNIVQAIRPFLDQLFSWMQANPQLMTTIVALLGVVASIGPIMTAAGMATKFLDTAMSALTGPWGLLIKLGMLFAVAMITNFGGVRDFFVKNFFPVIAAVGKLFGALFNALKPLLDALSKLFAATLGDILNMLKPFIDVLMAVIKIVTGFVQMLTGDAVGAMQSFSEAFGLKMPTSPGQDRQQRAQQMAMQGWQNGQGSNTASMPDFTLGNSNSNTSSANNYNFEIQMPSEAMGGGSAAQQAGQDFGASIAAEMQRLGVASP